MSQQSVSRYQIIDEIGRGGMATVYRAFDPMFRRDVAVKIMVGEHLQNSMMRARFEREAQTIAALEHPAIVPVYDFGEDDGRLFLVMRIMTGGTLTDRLKQGAMSVSETSTILQRIGGALERAHDNGIVHRDLKPSNILFDSYGDAFLADFGIARLTESTVTLTGQAVIGTPAYMSPEQIHGDKAIDGRSDIYALGVICFEMLTGQRPYWDDSPAKVMMKHIIDPVPNIRQVNPDLPDGIDMIIARTMAKEPDDRFSSASEMTDTLEAVIRLGMPPTTIPIPPQPPDQQLPDDQPNIPPLTPVVLANSAGDVEIAGEPAIPEPAPATEVEPPDFTSEPPDTEVTPPDFVSKPEPAIALALVDTGPEQIPETEVAKPVFAPRPAEAAGRPVRFPILIAGFLAVACVILTGIALVATGVLAPDEEQTTQLADSEPAPTDPVVVIVESAEEEPGAEAEDQSDSQPAVTTFVDPLADAESHMKEAYRLLEEGDIERALYEASLAIELAPNSARHYYERSELHLMLEEFDSAIDDANRAIELEPSAENFAQRGVIHRESGDLDRAIEDLHRAIELDPGDPYLYTELAILYRYLEDLEASLELLNRAIEIDSNNSQALAERSQTFQDLGDPESALDDALRAYELNPDQIWLLDIIAESYAWDQQDWERALEYYNMAIASEPEEAWRFTDRAVIYRLLGDGDAAMADHVRAFELEPDDIWHLVEKGITQLELFEDPDGAIATFERAMEIDPEDPRPYEERAWIHADYSGDLVAALADMDRAIELDPGAAWRYGDRAYLHQEMGNTDAAVNDYIHASELDPEDPWLLIDLGYFFFDEIGDAEAAFEVWNSAVERHPDNPDAYHARFLYFANIVADYDAALSDLSKCLELDPEKAWCYWERAWLFDTIGDVQAAIEDMQMYIEFVDVEDCPECVEEASDYIESNS
ncbi:MAG: tetratricopeptide repeat protein [Candidatus Promineifilaceae bacterium]